MIRKDVTLYLNNYQLNLRIPHIKIFDYLFIFFNAYLNI